MKPIKIFPEGTFIKGIDFNSEIQTNLFVDMIPQNINKDEFNILFLCEPDIISGISKRLPLSYKMFDYIITHNQNILDKYENAVLFTFLSVWATHKEYNPKEFNISTIVGNKTWTKHQVMRQELWYSQDEIPNSKFFISSFGGPENIKNNPVLKNNKDDAFMSQFHIAIENEITRHWFSEKILDCFITKTIPIYCGCPNIGDYFNENGILKFNNIKECINVCKAITKKTYLEILPFVEENYTKSLNYLNWQNRVSDFIYTLKIKK